MSIQSLQELGQQAQTLATGKVIPIIAAPTQTPAEQEVARVMQICNACRYCEGFCAVFPAMTRRLEFGKADAHYLANLCHNCGACLHACQYAPPHEFAINIPQAMAEVRGQTYADYAWPPALGRLYQRNGLTLSLAMVLGLFLFLALAVALRGGVGQLWNAQLGNNFYNLFPHGLMVGIFAPVFLLVVLALFMGVRRFWKEVKPATSGVDVGMPAAAEATPQVPRWRPWRGLPQRRRCLHAGAPPVSPFHLLRLCAVLCGNGAGHGVPLCLRPACALRAAQPAQGAGCAGRAGHDGGHGGPVAPAPKTSPAAR